MSWAGLSFEPGVPLMVFGPVCDGVRVAPNVCLVGLARMCGLFTLALGLRCLLGPPVSYGLRSSWLGVVGVVVWV